MTNSKIITVIAAFLAGVVMMAHALALPAIVERAKDTCVVGEQADGYLGFVPGKDASTELEREVRRINQQRKSVYADLARKNNVSVEVTAALTAEKLISNAQPGECVRGTDGEWVKK